MRTLGQIPQNIGNNILITNESYITQAFITEVILLNELSLNTPMNFLGEEIMAELRNNGSNVIVDFAVHNKPVEIKRKMSGLESRIRMWEATKNNEESTPLMRERASRCLYTVEQYDKGYSLYESRVLLFVRGKKGSDIDKALHILKKYFNKKQVSYTVVQNNIRQYLRWATLLGGQPSRKLLKRIPSLFTTTKVLAQLLPNTHGKSSLDGVYMGVNKVNNQPYTFDFTEVTKARNLYIVTDSGGGKTVMAMNMLISAIESGKYKGSVMDIKGTEFSMVCEAVGGKTISLTEDAGEYINTFKLYPDDVYADNFKMSVETLCILSGAEGLDNIKLHSLISRFLKYLYVSNGIAEDNRNTWKASMVFTPQYVYRELLKYIQSPDIRKDMEDIMEYVEINLGLYLAKDGIYRHTFTKEIRVPDLLDAKLLRFDFGLFKTPTFKENKIFEYKTLLMNIINQQYIRQNFNLGLYTMVILEESQAVSDNVLKTYSDYFTLYRSLHCVTILLGNSLHKLITNENSQPILENITGLLLGKLQKPTYELLKENFVLGNKSKVIEMMMLQSEYSRCFLFINNMVAEDECPILHLPFKDGKVSYMYKPTQV